MLRQPFEFCLINAHDDVAHSDAAAFGRWLAREQLLDPHHTGTQGLVWDVLLSAEAEAQPRRVLQQAHLKHIVCGATEACGGCQVEALDANHCILASQFQKTIYIKYLILSNKNSILSAASGLSG